MYDEEIHDILASHAERLMRAVVMAAMLGVAGYAVVSWMPDVSTFVSKSITTMRRIARTTSTAAREAGGVIATAAHDGWNAGE
jgi:uncharacterized protein YchJ